MQLTLRYNLLAAATCLLATFVHAETPTAETPTEVESRLSSSIGYLAADELGGRGVGTPGIDLAAKYIRDQFADMGLQVDAIDGDAYQPFEVMLGADLGEGNSVKIKAGNDTTIWKLEDDYTPLALGGAGEFNAPLAFVGYGITAPEANYDDYAGIDVKGRIVIIVRHEPRQADPESDFNGTRPSEHAPFRTKVSNALKNGAVGVVFCNDLFEVQKAQRQYEKRRDAAVAQLADIHRKFTEIEKPSDEAQTNYRRRTTQMARRIAEWAEAAAEQEDSILGFDRAGQSNRDVPVMFASRSAIDAVLDKAGSISLAEFEEQTDEDLKPRSTLLEGVELTANIDIKRESVPAKNVIAVLEGAGPHADETVVIGAHFDHVGRGGPGSGAADPRKNEIHNGADDNASGTSVLLEVARQLASRPDPPARRVVFIAFSGEERGLLGSAHYVDNPPFPLENTVAMLNMDMVGRLKNNNLILNGTGTAKEFEEWIDNANEKLGFDLAKVPGGFGPSDHASFYAKQIPVLHFFTGLHDQYHKPSDDVELLNVVGMRRISDFVGKVAEQVIESPDGVTYLETKGPSTPTQKVGTRPYFGSIPQFGSNAKGYAISGVAAESPAAEGGLQGGDVIVGLAEMEITNLDDFDSGLRKFSAGDKVKVSVMRNGEKIDLEVTLDPPR